MSALDFDPMEQASEIPVKPISGSPQKIVSKESIERNQLPFMRVIARMHDLFWDLPKITTRDVDARLQELFDLFMDAAGTAGISRMSVPQLKECCGQKRVWPDEIAQAIEEHLEPKLGWWPGDIIRRITKLLGFKHCPKCEERRKAINRLFQFTRK